ncbi:hypothetical protein PAXRUDRAFT_827917 [Paxillus rubicundulus Ve08.2h10]|uniref:Uncharacterized protein n=1 Tax=Paxillus rubicundulus Ve08.2h10 TaxID=930991 RepID=A0A0D0E815_9AGAM|nr:hypothetical protein PAXRUDRAFT_827917 [Paxillus rubicundulus Ve08.2h10]
MQMRTFDSVIPLGMTPITIQHHKSDNSSHLPQTSQGPRSHLNDGGLLRSWNINWVMSACCEASL